MAWNKDKPLSTDSVSSATTSIPANWAAIEAEIGIPGDASTGFLAQHEVSGLHREISIGASGGRARFMRFSPFQTIISHNASHNGATWEAEDTAEPAYQLSIRTSAGAGEGVIIRKKLDTSVPWALWDSDELILYDISSNMTTPGDVTVGGDVIIPMANVLKIGSQQISQQNPTTLRLNNSLHIDDYILVDLNDTGSKLYFGSAKAINLYSPSSDILKTDNSFEVGEKLIGEPVAFLSYLSVNQLIVTGVYTKISLNLEIYDTNSSFDNVTNFRFTPGVKGKYNISAQVAIAPSLTSFIMNIQIRRNGSVEFQNNSAIISGLGGNQHSSVSADFDVTNTSDYFEIFVRQNSGGSLPIAGVSQFNTFFSGHLIALSST